MGLVLDWQRKLGYTKDPFEPQVSPASRHLVGMQPLQERLNLFLIKEERFGTIAGEQGSGKSLLLQWMEEELAPQKSHDQHLFDAKEASHDDIVTELLRARLSFLEKKFGKILKLPMAEQKKELLQRLARDQRNVLLIDNAGHLGRPELELLSDIVIKTPTHLIFADTEAALKKLPLPETLIDKLKLKIPTFDHDQLLEMLQNRIESSGGTGTFPFSESDITDLIKKSDRNPAKLLQLARERAIELSLKVRNIPAQPAQVKQASGGFFSIKVQRVGQQDEAPAVLVQTRETPVEEDMLPEADMDDEDMLQKVVTQAPVAAQQPKPKDTLPIENVDSVVVEQKKTKKARSKEFDKLAHEFAKHHVKKKRK